jgi:hypothetical protein
VAPSRRTTANALAGIALAALLLTGCSGGGGEIVGEASSSAPDSGSESGSGAGQTTEEACEVLKTGVTDTIEKLQAGLSEIQTDPAAASAAVGSLATAFEESAADVTNKDVRVVADDATAALAEFSTQIQAYAANPEAADATTQKAVTDSATAVQTAMTKVGTTCP